LQVSLRYWSLALHFISEPHNRDRLIPRDGAAPVPFVAAASSAGGSNLLTKRDYAGSNLLTSRDVGGGGGGGLGIAMTARTKAKETYNAYDENQVNRCLHTSWSESNCRKFRVTNVPQLSVMRAFLSKARHGRLDELLQMLDARMVSVDAVDEYGNTVLIVAAQNNLKKIVKVRVPCSFSAPNPLLRISHQSQAVLRRGAYVTPCFLYVFL
jgi:hypothetical protein